MNFKKNKGFLQIRHLKIIRFLRALLQVKREDSLIFHAQDRREGKKYILLKRERRRETIQLIFLKLTKQNNISEKAINAIQAVSKTTERFEIRVYYFS